MDSLISLRQATAMVADQFGNGILWGLLFVVILVGLAIAFRRRSLAIAGLYVAQLAVYGVAAGGNLYIFAASAIIAAIWTLVIVRVGLLSIATASTIFSMAFFYSIGFDGPPWMLPSTIAPVVFIALLTAFAFRTALGGQAMFSAKLLDD
jgi:hypothetical protein